jgi:hypothetical protein
MKKYVIITWIDIIRVSVKILSEKNENSDNDKTTAIKILIDFLFLKDHRTESMSKKLERTYVRLIETCLICKLIINFTGSVKAKTRKYQNNSVLYCFTAGKIQKSIERLEITK